jgi:hypothetical protein
LNTPHLVGAVWQRLADRFCRVTLLLRYCAPSTQEGGEDPMEILTTQLKEARKELTSTKINHEAQVVGACRRMSLLHCL